MNSGGEAIRPRWRIRGVDFHGDSPGLQQALSIVHGTGERPICLCVAKGVPMVVARMGQYVLRRMPDSGEQHHPGCPSYAPPPAMSGLSELMGQAVVEHPSGVLEIRAEFAWQSGSRQTQVPATLHAATVARTVERRISLQALMHLLLERAGFNRWGPGIVGRRDQASLRQGLLTAAGELHVNGESLAERLYVPEPFSREQMHAVAQRRRNQLRYLHAAGGQAIALVVGEYKGSDEVEYGHRLWLRHMPDVPILVPDRDWVRIRRIFANVLAARDADVASAARVLVAMLVRTRSENLYQLEALWLSLTTREWIPMAYAHELPLIAHLVESRRSFIKPLHYDAVSAALYPSVVLLDAGAHAVRLDILSPLAPARDRLLKERALARAGDAGWVWHTHDPIPALPAPVP